MNEATGTSFVPAYLLVLDAFCRGTMSVWALFLCFLYLNEVAWHIAIQGRAVFVIAVVCDVFSCDLWGWMASESAGGGACSCGLGYNNTGGVPRDACCQLLSCAKTPLIARREKTRCSRGTAEAVSVLNRVGEGRSEGGVSCFLEGLGGSPASKHVHLHVRACV